MPVEYAVHQSIITEQHRLVDKGSHYPPCRTTKHSSVVRCDTVGRVIRRLLRSSRPLFLLLYHKVAAESVDMLYRPSVQFTIVFIASAILALPRINVSRQGVLRCRHHCIAILTNDEVFVFAIALERAGKRQAITFTPI